MELRICIAIPTYNNSISILNVVGEVLKACTFPIVVIDDGSEKPVIDILNKQDYIKPHLKSQRLRVIRFSENQGKGYALQAAFHFAQKNNYTHILSMDADGQHLTSEIQPLVTCARQKPFDLIIGCRKMDQSAPGISHFGRKFSNFWVNYQTDLAIKDSQSGLRVYPIFHVQNFSFFTKKYDFEIEVLIRCLWTGISITEVLVDVYYPKAEERVSHFDKLWDNIRISFLNFILTLISMCRSRSTLYSSISFATGLCIGASPFFGLHWLIALATSFLFRLNFPAILLGTQISIPPLVPLLIFTEFSLYEFFFSKKLAISNQSILELGKLHLQQWFTGWLLLCPLLFLLGVTFWLSTSKLLRRKKTNWTGKSRGGLIGNFIITNTVKSLSLQAGYFCLYFIVPYFYIFAPQGRKALNEYWKKISSKNFMERQITILKHFFAFGKVLMDRVVHFSRRGNYFEVEYLKGFESVKQDIESNTPTILLLSHVGSWEIAQLRIMQRGLNKPIHFLEYANSPPQHSQQIETVNKNKILVAPGRPIFSEIHKVLKEGNTLAIMADRPFDSNYEMIQFFDALAPFPSTPFKLAQIYKANLHFILSVKTTNKYRLISQKIPVNKDLQSNISSYALLLQETLKTHPYQWFNFYPFWSSIPTLPDGNLCLPQKVMVKSFEFRTYPATENEKAP